MSRHWFGSVWRVLAGSTPPAQVSRVVLSALLALLVTVPVWGQPAPLRSGPWSETRFQTGCSPGPYEPFQSPDPALPPLHRVPPQGSETAQLQVDLGAPIGRPILGSGFNLEHALGSCSAFEPLLGSDIIDPFHPAIARVDTGLLPAAPPDLSPQQLNSAVYQSVLNSAPYTGSWDFIRRLNRDGVRVILGVWGGPAQFTHNGERRGVLLPWYYDDYVDYLVSVVDYIVRRQGTTIWAITIANEPDGGDGNQISPEGVLYIAQKLAPRLAPYGVKLYGPDTGSAAAALDYLPLLLHDPTVAPALAFVGFHEYNANPDVADVVDYVQRVAPHLPVVVTEYTSFLFGDLDAGEEVTDRMGFTLDSMNTVLSHYQHGADAAIYWDAVDYLQPGHDAITRWGILRGPEAGFARRPSRYYGFYQVLSYLQSGAQVVHSTQQGGVEIGSLAVRTPQNGLVVFLINRGTWDVDLTVAMRGQGAGTVQGFYQMRTTSQEHAASDGWMALRDGAGTLSLPARSITTLTSFAPPPPPAARNASALGATPGPLQPAQFQPSGPSSS